MKNKFTKTLNAFIEIESLSSLLLLFITLFTMLLANSTLSTFYFDLTNSFYLKEIVNDFLMAIFFYVIALEIKKEFIQGELSSLSQSVLPIASAIGGMIIPAFIYYNINRHSDYKSGFGIPMATDIAFAVGVLSLFGKKVPHSLKLFLLSIAVVDDLGAILVIALFYNNKIIFTGILIAFFSLMFILYLLKKEIQHLLPYLFLALFFWYGIFKSGIHATIAGVILGFITPLTFKQKNIIDYFISKLHSWVNFLILPLFSFFNAGIFIIGINFTEIIHHPIHYAIVFGLLLGKFIGIFGTTFILIKMRLVKLPKATNLWQLLSVSILGGIGFTMSLFISELALPIDMQLYSKMGIIFGSILSALIGAFTLLLTLG